MKSLNAKSIKLATSIAGEPVMSDAGVAMVIADDEVAQRALLKLGSAALQPEEAFAAAKHASSHAEGGEDPITPSSIGAESAGTAAGLIADLGLDSASQHPATDFVSSADSRLTDSRNPLAHTQDISTINGLTTALAGKESAGTASTLISGLGLGTAATHASTDFDPAGAAASVTAASINAQGKTVASAALAAINGALNKIPIFTGTSTASTIDVSSLEPALGNPVIAGQVPSKNTAGVVTWITPASGTGSGNVTSVNGHTGPDISLVMSDIPGLVTGLAGKESTGTALAAIEALGLGTVSTHAVGEFATSTQGGKADAAVQPASLSSASVLYAVSAGTAATSGTAATVTSLSGHSVSELTNDAGYVTSSAAGISMDMAVALARIFG